MTPGNFLLMLAIVWPPGAGLLCWWLFRLMGLPPRARLDPVAFPWLVAALAGACIDAFLTLRFPTVALPAAVNTAQAGVALAIWWWRRKDRKRAAKALGAKSRARIAALVATLRGQARPRLVPGPQPS